MSDISYTTNLNLGMQLNKNDKFNWSVITENWRKIDNAMNGDDEQEEGSDDE